MTTQNLLVLTGLLAFSSGCMTYRRVPPPATVHEPLPVVRFEVEAASREKVITENHPTDRTQFEQGMISEPRAVYRLVRAVVGPTAVAQAARMNHQRVSGAVSPDLIATVALMRGSTDSQTKPSVIRAALDYEVKWTDAEHRVLAVTRGTGHGTNGVNAVLGGILSVLNPVTLYVIPAWELDGAFASAYRQAATDVMLQVGQVAQDPEMLSVVYAGPATARAEKDVAQYGMECFEKALYFDSYYVFRPLKQKSERQAALGFTGASLLELGWRDEGLKVMRQCIDAGATTPMAQVAAEWIQAGAVREQGTQNNRR